MKWRVKKSNGEYRLSGGAIATIGIAVIAIAALAAVGMVYIEIAQLSNNAVPFAENAPETIAPTAETNLPAMTGVPSDITEDYDDPSLPQQATPKPIYYAAPIDEDYINILVVGSDSRSGDAKDGRCDTMMLLSYDIKNNKASIVSFMRDTWVPIAGHNSNRLNASFRFGGVGLTINTLNSLFDLDIQDYIIVNFNGMIDLINEIGGIDIKITEAEAEYYNENFEWHINAGMNHLDGEKTLIHARNRHSGGGDFERTRRQRDIIVAVIEEVSDKQDLQTLSDMFGFFIKNVNTNMNPEKLFSLVMSGMTSEETFDITQNRIPADKTWRYANKDGRSVIVIDLEKNKKILQEEIYTDKSREEGDDEDR